MSLSFVSRSRSPSQAGLDLGDRHLLLQYDRERRPANLAMMAGLDGLHRLFGGGTEGPGYARGEQAAQPAQQAAWWTRNVGLAALNGAGPAKAALARFAMGLGQNSP